MVQWGLVCGTASQSIGADRVCPYRGDTVEKSVLALGSAMAWLVSCDRWLDIHVAERVHADPD